MPYARYGESVDSVVAAIESVRREIEAGADRARLQSMLPPGAARNALDCALWDLEAKTTGVSAWRRAGLAAPGPTVTAYTISVDTPDAMAGAAARAAGRPLLKVKLAGEGDRARLAAVRAAAPCATLVVDANEAWRPADLAAMLEACAQAGVALVEQPLPADDDAALAGIAHPVPICADESVHGLAGLAALRDRYDAVNIKLDKTGGLTEALAVTAEAQRLGFSIMIGCMVGTSLAMAPALLLAERAAYVDLDGPLLLAKDRPEGAAVRGLDVAAGRAGAVGVAHPPPRSEEDRPSLVGLAYQRPFPAVPSVQQIGEPIVAERRGGAHDRAFDEPAEPPCAPRPPPHGSHAIDADIKLAVAIHRVETATHILQARRMGPQRLGLRVDVAKGDGPGTGGLDEARSLEIDARVAHRAFDVVPDGQRRWHLRCNHDGGPPALHVDQATRRTPGRATRSRGCLRLQTSSRRPRPCNTRQPMSDWPGSTPRRADCGQAW